MRVAVLALLVVLAGVVCVSVGQKDPVIKQVQIITRHGARATFTDIPNYPAYWYCNLNPLSIPGLGVGDQTQFAGRLYRKSYLNGRESLLGNCSEGQLTYVGLNEHYHLGVIFRKRYVDQLNLLSPNYDSQELFIRAADVERCVLSAQGQLDGLYPPSSPGNGLANIIPIYTIEQALDDVETGGRCPELVNQCNLLQNTTAWINYISQFKPLTQYLASSWNVPISQVPDYAILYGILEAREAQNIPPPPGITSEIYQQILAYASWQLTGAWNDTRRVSLAIGPLITEIYDRFVNVISNSTTPSSNPKYILYSAHDITVSAVLSALGIFDGIWPPFASHVQIELYQDSESEEWYVGILYNGNMLYLPGCNGMWYCPWSVFENVANEVMLSGKKWNQVCQLGMKVTATTDISLYIC